MIDWWLIDDDDADDYDDDDHYFNDTLHILDSSVWAEIVLMYHTSVIYIMYISKTIVWSSRLPFLQIVGCMRWCTQGDWRTNHILLCGAVHLDVQEGIIQRAVIYQIRNT